MFEGDIKMSSRDAGNIIFQDNGQSRQTRAVTSDKDKLWPANVPYAIDSSLGTFKSTTFRLSYFYIAFSALSILNPAVPLGLILIPLGYLHMGKSEHVEVQSHFQCHGRWTFDGFRHYAHARAQGEGELV